MKVRRKNILFIMVLLAIIATAKIYFDNNFLEVSQYTVTSNKIPTLFKGFKILQLSDLHSRNFGNYNNRLIKKINGENPDIIVMTGDMVNTRGTDSINLYGLWFNLRYYKDLNNEYTKDVFFEAEQIQTILGNLDTDSYNILLTHNPLYSDTYSNWGADLTLSGHIHGGMIRVPFIGGLLSPEREFFPKYDAGKYQVNGKVLIVNRGLGNGDFGIRIFNRPEISVITLSD